MSIRGAVAIVVPLKKIVCFGPSPQQPLPHLRRDNLRAAGAAAVAGHDGAALHTHHAALAVDDALHDGEALVAQLLHLGGDVDAVVVMDLRLEVDIVVHHHHGEVALGGRHAVRGEELVLAQVEVLHDDGVIDVPHLVHVVESDLNICFMHGVNGLNGLFFE